MRRWSQYVVVMTLILAVGGHWAFLQSIAWVSMTVTYSRDASLLVALEKTFSGQHPCKLCKAVREGKQEEQQQASPAQETKLEFLHPQSAFLLSPQIVDDHPIRYHFSLITRPQPPPTPPPRVA